MKMMCWKRIELVLRTIQSSQKLILKKKSDFKDNYCR